MRSSRFRGSASSAVVTSVQAVTVQTTTNTSARIGFGALTVWRATENTGFALSAITLKISTRHGGDFGSVGGGIVKMRYFPGSIKS